jgi:hypothetical protein
MSASGTILNAFSHDGSFNAVHRLNFAVIKNEFYNDLLVVDPSDQHISNLDPITITEDDFRKIFYSDASGALSNNFGMGGFHVNETATDGSGGLLSNKISFSQALRSVGGEAFSLLQTILNNYCSDANVDLAMFTPCSLIALTSQTNAIKTLSEVYTNRSGLKDTAMNWDASGVCALTWNEIVETVSAPYDYLSDAEYDAKGTADTILTISAVFTSPAAPRSNNKYTTAFKPTIVKFNFRTSITLLDLLDSAPVIGIPVIDSNVNQTSLENLNAVNAVNDGTHQSNPNTV